MQDQNQEKEFIPEIENQTIFSKHKILVDSSLKSLQTPEGVNSYAKKAVKRVIGDDAEISAVKLKRPNIFKKASAKLFNRTPQAKLYVTTKF